MTTIHHENNIAKIANKLATLAGDHRTDFEIARAAIATADQFVNHFNGLNIHIADWDQATDSAAETVALMRDRKVRKATIINKQNVRLADFVFKAATIGKAGFDRIAIAGLARRSVRIVG